MVNGGHQAYVEMRDTPEWSARNQADIVRVINSMLITAGEPSTSGSPSNEGTTLVAEAHDVTE